MQPGTLMYEGKAKQVYTTGNDDRVLMVYKDDATAFNGAKKGVIKNKGMINNRITCMLFKLLEKEGIPTHLLEKIDERTVLVKKLQMLPLEVVMRNRIAGSLVKRVGKEEGTELPASIMELYYKDDDLGDPMINDYHARVMGWVTEDQLEQVKARAFKINEVLQKFFDSIGIILVDFKLEFGIYEGEVVLGDEISPDSCRLWDKESLEKLDKDRFRRDLGKEEEAYLEVVRRIEKVLVNN
jgi:phosphoribosylaminoimidazole-succinocarboxamide synthase